jgi:hypothetical protein
VNFVLDESSYFPDFHAATAAAVRSARRSARRAAFRAARLWFLASHLATFNRSSSPDMKLIFRGTALAAASIAMPEMRSTSALVAPVRNASVTNRSNSFRKRHNAVRSGLAIVRINILKVPFSLSGRKDLKAHVCREGP